MKRIAECPGAGEEIGITAGPDDIRAPIPGPERSSPLPDASGDSVAAGGYDDIML